MARQSYQSISQSRLGSRVAHVRDDYGQRVQFSAFECRLDDVLFETFLEQIATEIDRQEDRLRAHCLPSKSRRLYTCWVATDGGTRTRPRAFKARTASCCRPSGVCAARSAKNSNGLAHFDCSRSGADTAR